MGGVEGKNIDILFINGMTVGSKVVSAVIGYSTSLLNSTSLIISISTVRNIFLSGVFESLAR
jgi:hypothetical protein